MVNWLSIGGLNEMSQLNIVSQDVCPHCGTNVDTTFTLEACPHCDHQWKNKSRSSISTSVGVGTTILLLIAGGILGRSLGYFKGQQEGKQEARQYTIEFRTPPNITSRARPILDNSGVVIGYSLMNGREINISKCRTDGRCPDDQGRFWEIVK